MGELANIMSRPMPIFVTGFGRFFIKPHVPPPPSSQEVFEEESGQAFPPPPARIRTRVQIFSSLGSVAVAGGPMIRVLLNKLGAPSSFLTLLIESKEFVFSTDRFRRLQRIVVSTVFAAGPRQRQYQTVVNNAPDDASLTATFSLFFIGSGFGGTKTVPVSWVFNKPDLKKMLSKQPVERIIDFS